MKRYSTVLIGLIALSALAYDYRTIHGQQPGTRRDVTSGAATPAITEEPKGKALVEKLPQGVEGVVLERAAQLLDRAQGVAAAPQHPGFL